VLHVELVVKPGLQKSLEDTFVAAFSPAISQLDGSRQVDLLRPVEDSSEYRLSIAFEDRASQQVRNYYAV